MTRLEATSPQSTPDRGRIAAAPAPSITDTLAAAAARIAAVSEDARLESEVLLGHALGIDRARLLARLRDPISPDTRVRSEALVARRLRREPLAYITGRREFYGLDIACAPGALIPRPETEALVDIALAEARRRAPGTVRIADVGTGSGCIAIAIAANSSNALITATDISLDALRIARANEASILSDRTARITSHQSPWTAKIHFVRTDLLDGLRRFDVIVANLPYVPADEYRALAPEVRDHEPAAALIGGEHGTEAIERLLARAPAHLAPGGVLVLEFGFGQARQLVERAIAAFRGADVAVERDLAGIERILIIRTGA